MSAAPMVEIEDLVFDYGGGSFRLELPRLVIGRGERVACIGPSGSGKTTLINLATGILVPRAGTVRLDGERIDGLSDAARRARRISKVGMVFQEFELLEYLSARENLLLPYFVSGRLTLDAAVKERAAALAEALGIDAILGRRPARLSQGERQRVAIGRALVTEPVLIVADEPTGNLDPRNANRTLDLLFERARERDAALLVVTHDHGLLERFDRVIDLARDGGGVR
ncbi:MAG: ATP-binding cassette domain-containing protein [Planctomycetota bacterium]